MARGRGRADCVAAVFEDSRRWCFLTLKPGTEPLKSLIGAFLDTWQFGATDPERVKQQKGWIDLLRDGEATLRDLLDATERRHNELDQSKAPAFFLYVDQGEELYVRSDERERQRFSEIVADALLDPRLRAMMSMRSDFLGGLQNDEPLFNVHRQISVPPLREAALREVVSRPAHLLGARFEREACRYHYPTRCGGFGQGRWRPAAAFIHARRHMDANAARWRWEAGFPPKSFELGGVLVNRANTFLENHPGVVDVLRRVLTLRLATVRDDGEPTRRRAARSEFSPQEWRLVSDLADYPNRLLITATTESRETYAEVAHEAIFRRWDTLRDWIAGEREFLIWRSGLEAARRAWEGAPDRSKHHALLVGFALGQAKQWFAKRADDIPKADRQFIEQSGRAARQRQLRIRALVGVLAIALVVGLTAP